MSLARLFKDLIPVKEKIKQKEQKTKQNKTKRGGQSEPFLLQNFLKSHFYQWPNISQCMYSRLLSRLNSVVKHNCTGLKVRILADNWSYKNGTALKSTALCGYKFLFWCAHSWLQQDYFRCHFFYTKTGTHQCTRAFLWISVNGVGKGMGTCSSDLAYRECI